MQRPRQMDERTNCLVARARQSALLGDDPELAVHLGDRALAVVEPDELDDEA